MYYVAAGYELFPLIPPISRAFSYKSTFFKFHFQSSKFKPAQNSNPDPTTLLIGDVGTPCRASTTPTSIIPPPASPFRPWTPATWRSPWAKMLKCADNNHIITIKVDGSGDTVLLCLKALSKEATVIEINEPVSLTFAL
ncbi:uncharacterized protein LOC109812702 [Cajanus cajan]|uniref:uncharacterized protein LOC109812702 n=1 Tax=Cajanus cajan TaxID=3821 RepID=UPI00098DA7FE|nr:uncharacterized protein LOC109812702 [Cajanus cajan]